jgi:hypothetical protein
MLLTIDLLTAVAAAVVVAIDIIPLYAWKNEDNPSPWDHCSALWTQSVLKHWNLVKETIVSIKVPNRNITTIIHDRQVLRIAYVNPQNVTGEDSLVIYYMNIQFNNPYNEYYFIASDNSKVWCYTGSKFNDSLPIIMDDNTSSVLEEEMHRCELVQCELQQLTKRWDSTQCNTTVKKPTEAPAVRRFSKYI